MRGFGGVLRAEIVYSIEGKLLVSILSRLLYIKDAKCKPHENHKENIFKISRKGNEKRIISFHYKRLIKTKEGDGGNVGYKRHQIYTHTQSKMAIVNPAISVITLDVNGLH